VVVDDLHETPAERPQGIPLRLLDALVPAFAVRRVQLPPDARRCGVRERALRAPAPAALDHREQLGLGETPMTAGGAEDLDIAGVRPAPHGRLVHTEQLARSREADPSCRLACGHRS